MGSMMAKKTLLVLGSPLDPDLQPLKRLENEFSITIADTEAECKTAFPECEVLVYWKANIELVRAAVRAAPKLRLLHCCKTGVENMLFPEMIESPALLTNAAGIVAGSLAEWVLTAILFFEKDLRRLLRNQAAGRWEQFTVQEVRGKSMTIVGFGGIGKEIASRALAMGMQVNALRNNPETDAAKKSAVRELPITELHNILPTSEYLVIAAPLTPSTKGLIGERELSLLPPSAILINVGRGLIVDEDALIRSLQQNRIRGAGLDVFGVEPLPQEHPFYGMENVLLSPHCADHTSTMRSETLLLCLANLERYARNETLLNIVDKTRGY